jgi:hypothetical protein
MIWYVVSSSLHEKHFDPQAIQTSWVVEFRSPNANLLKFKDIDKIKVAISEML